MYAKVVILILGLAAAAAVLLGLRQQRYELGNEMVVTHRRMQEARRTVWNLQADLAGRLQPHRLEQSVAQSRLPLEPVMPLPSTGGGGTGHTRGPTLARGRR